MYVEIQIPTRSAACVIAQQYSSAAFASLLSRCHKKKFGVLVKRKLLLFLKLRNSEIS
jgi:hypothetical protein